MAALHVETNNIAMESNEAMENRLSSDEFSSDEDLFNDNVNGDSSNNIHKDASKKSGMANVISRILSKDTSKSNRLLLAKGKTNREILSDITRRRQKRGEDTSTKDEGETKEEEGSREEQKFKEEKRKLWENMGRKTAPEMDFSREAKLRKIATQGMVQLFQSVHDHQKVMNQKISSVGPSERKRDQIRAEFTKGKFLDVLKSKNVPQVDSNQDSFKQNDSGQGKWKILQDDFMMGAQMKDWDKDGDDDDDDDDDDNDSSD